MSSIIIDRKFIGLASGRLRNLVYKNTSTVIASFSHSCERRESNKKRGHFLTYKGSTFMRCFNCSESLPLSKFIQEVDPSLYKEYCIENFKEGIWESKDGVVLPPTVRKIEKPKTDYFEGLIPYTSLPENHSAMNYILDRKIPRARYEQFFIAPKFYTWASKISPIFSKFIVQVPRLIIPYYGLNKELLGFSCRAFGKEIPKYIHLRTDDTQEFIYGQDFLDIKKPILVTEGQIDSMFLDNCVGIGRASYNSELLKKYKPQIIIIPDNDFRRNFHVCEQLKKIIIAGYAVCLLPDYWKKDINEIIISGISSLEIENYVLSNKKSGASALLELANERKC